MKAHKKITRSCVFVFAATIQKGDIPAMSSRKFHALFFLGMMILVAMFTGGCGGSGGSDVSLVEQNPSPTPITSQDTTPSPSPVPIISSDPTPTQFTVTFDSYGGSEVSAQIVNAGSNAEVPDEPY